MSKRGANTYLTHDNWDNEEEEESEEPGVFVAASREMLEKREIKKAKRRGVTAGASSSGSGGAFQGFSFGSSSNGQSSTGKPFSFSVDTAKSSVAMSLSQNPVATTSMASLATTSSTTSTMSDSKTTDDEEAESEYRKNLRTLNESVLKWIGDHISRNPYCILSPIFADYERYIVELDKEYPSNSSTNMTEDDSTKTVALESKTVKSEAPPAFNTNVKFSFGSVSSAPAASTTVASLSTFSFAPSNAAASTESADASKAKPFTFGAMQPASSTFSFLGSSAATTTTTSSIAGATVSTAGTSSFNAGFFGAPKSADGSVAPLTFGASKPGEGFKFGQGSLTFGSLFPAAPASETKTEGEGGGGGAEDEDYVPPKPEVVETKEEGAFYSIRCKLFYKKDDKFQERGLGFLHLKSCGDNAEKTQLIIRTDTALGNILLNIILSKNIPVAKQGNNNVTMMCIPNPPIDDKKSDGKQPVLFLIRVKTSDDADALLKQLNECKSKLS